MSENFIAKLETENYQIGSFDVHLELSKALIKNNSNLTDEETEEILKSMPTNYRASIVDKSGDYIGYIGVFNVDAKANTASIRYEVNKDLPPQEKYEILTEYQKYLRDTLNLTEIEEFTYSTPKSQEMSKRVLVPKSNIIISNTLLVPGVSNEVLEKYSKDYTIPRMQMPFTIMSGDRAIGIVGLSSVIWSNRRANLNIFLDKELGSDISNELSGYIIDDYVNYVHDSNIHNLTLSVTGSNKDLLKLINDTNMNYYGQIPYGEANDGNIESRFMFQHLPNTKKENGIIVPENKSVEISSLDTGKTELSEIIELDNGFRMISPRALEKENIDVQSVMRGHIHAMQDREGFAAPLGEDKYFLQVGNGNYGISKAVMNYSYVVLDDNNNYAGYINILRTNANNRNAEIEIGIDPKIQNRGLGTKVINKFYDELFSVGYASVTSAIFEFNKPSLRLHEKVAELNGIRLESYYINGRLWDMNFYSRVNDAIDNTNKPKQA